MQAKLCICSINIKCVCDISFNSVSGCTALILKIGAVILTLVFCYGAYNISIDYVSNGQVKPMNIPESDGGGNSTNMSLSDVVHRYAVDGLVVIASFDVTYASMALNLYLTSFKRFNVTNHLFLASDGLGCAELESSEAHCIQYSSIATSKVPSIYSTLDYNIKANIKPRLVLECLKLGVSVLLVDLDIVFLKNPLPIVTKCPDCDFVTHIDRSGINSGFFLVRPTRAGITLFDKVVNMITDRPTGDQVYVNRAFHEMKQNGRIKYQFLPQALFPVGRIFFKEGHRIFIGDNPCTKCVIVHNNYIISLEAKRYRFMEYGLWEVDKNGYYSSTDRRYIRFDNPIDSQSSSLGAGGFNTQARELQSLTFALILGHILNRTVILPAFHCKGATGYSPQPKNQMCHFGVHFCVRQFERELSAVDPYREHVFLQHNMVPEATKKSASPTYLINSDVWQNISRDSISPGTRVLRPGSMSGVSVRELLGWFSAQVLCQESPSVSYWVGSPSRFYVRSLRP